MEHRARTRSGALCKGIECRKTGNVADDCFRPKAVIDSRLMENLFLSGRGPDSLPAISLHSRIDSKPLTTVKGLAAADSAPVGSGIAYWF